MLGPLQCGIRHIVYKAYFDATCQKSLKVVVPISKATFCLLQRTISFDDKQLAAFLNDRSVLLAQRRLQQECASPHKLCGADPPKITRRSASDPSAMARSWPIAFFSQSSTRTIVRIQTID